MAVFLSEVRLSSGSALFPYTTLFRSAGGRCPGSGQRRFPRPARSPRRDPVRPRDPHGAGRRNRLVPFQIDVPVRHPARRGRNTGRSRPPGAKLPGKSWNRTRPSRLLRSFLRPLDMNALRAWVFKINTKRGWEFDAYFRSRLSGPYEMGDEGWI